MNTLTPRELAVLELVADGLSNAEIGLRCGINTNTVRSHLRVLYDKLGVTNRTQAAAVMWRLCRRKAIQCGRVDLRGGISWVRLGIDYQNACANIEDINGAWFYRGNVAAHTAA
jgi:DNA-binding CsgD family transcriptional regulator